MRNCELLSKLTYTSESPYSYEDAGPDTLSGYEIPPGLEGFFKHRLFDGPVHLGIYINDLYEDYPVPLYLNPYTELVFRPDELDQPASTVQLWAGCFDSNPVLAKHMARVYMGVRNFGRYLQLPKPEQTALETAALLHDLAKVGDYYIGIRRYLNTKFPGSIEMHNGDLAKFFPQAVRFERSHALIMADTLALMGYPDAVIETVALHHKNYDGSGYPVTSVQYPHQQTELAGILRLFDRSDAKWKKYGQNGSYHAEEHLRQLDAMFGREIRPDLRDPFRAFLMQNMCGFGHRRFPVCASCYI